MTTATDDVLTRVVAGVVGVMLTCIDVVVPLAVVATAFAESRRHTLRRCPRRRHQRPLVKA